MPNIVFDNEAYGSMHPLGGKADALACLQKNGLPVPQWLAITPEPLTADVTLGETFKANLAKALGVCFTPNELLAVRSSAIEEDGQAHSFAGMFESYLFVRPDDVAEKILDIWRSAKSDRVLAYCKEHDLPAPTHTPAVIVQRMINAEAAGVAFSADPVTGLRDIVVISAVHGLGSSLVSGETNADMAYVTPENTLVHYSMADKSVMHRLKPRGGIDVVTSPENIRRLPAISEAEAVAIAGVIRKAEKIYGTPQDMEWAIANNQLFVLQSRPITSLPKIEQVKAQYTVLNNVTLAESWHGPVTPLTFSFAQRLVKNVYQILSRETCLAKTPYEHVAPLFEDLVSNVEGRLYLNQTQLDRIWHYTPSLEYKLAQFYGGKLAANEQIPVATLFWKLVLFWLLLPWHNARFIARVDKTLGKTGPKDGDSEANLRNKLKETLDTLDHHWTVPALNNYLAASLYKLANHISPVGASLGGETEAISRDLTGRMQAMAQLAKKDPALLAALQTGNIDAVKKHAGFYKKLQDYLTRYGERCREEMKLESPSLSDDPAPLLKTIAAMVNAPEHKRVIAKTEEQLTGNKKRFWTLLLVLTKRQVARRERLRYELTRIAGRVRTLVVALGKKQANPDDVFYMALDELISGAGNSPIAERREAHQKNTASPEPPPTLAGYGPIRFTQAKPLAPDATEVFGIGCSPGRVEGSVKIYSPDRLAEDYANAILVAPYGDPGLVVLFPLLKGLLFAQGSALSHAAIVARELGVPAVTGIPGLMDWLCEDEVVTLDGETGLVKKN